MMQLTKLDLLHRRVKLMKLMLNYKQAGILTQSGYDFWYSRLSAEEKIIWKRRFGELQFSY